MSRYRRLYVPGGTYFFTVNLAHRGGDLLVQQIDLLRQAVRDTQAQRAFRIDAMVVLPDHLHAVWTLPAGDKDFSIRWAAIKGRFSRDVRRAGCLVPQRLPRVETGMYAGVNPGLRARKGEVAIWQRRFWEHWIRSPEDFSNHVEYCHSDPVKHGLVERAEDWPYSSVHRAVKDRQLVAKGGGTPRARHHS